MSASVDAKKAEPEPVFEPISPTPLPDDSANLAEDDFIEGETSIPRFIIAYSDDILDPILDTWIERHSIDTVNIFISIILLGGVIKSHYS